MTRGEGKGPPSPQLPSPAHPPLPPRPSQAKFLTRIWHPQVKLPEGEPCVDVLKKEWKPTMSLRNVLLTLRQLIGSPTKDDSVNADAAGEIGRSLAEFEKHAREETAKWAVDG